MIKKYRFTIITVCYNAQEHIEETIRSVLDQTFTDMEYVIKDGMSTDHTMDIVEALTENDRRVRILRGQDGGIYDAMNLAAGEAAGEYLLFMNAGDVLAEGDILARVNHCIEQEAADIFYGNVIEIGSGESHLRLYTGKNSKLWYYSLGACLCHQSMFCKRELFQQKLFDLNYRVCADREWQMYHLRHGARAKSLGYTVAKVLMEGFSSSHVEELEQECSSCVKRYCGLWYLVYCMIGQVKKSRSLRKLVAWAERQMSCR